MNEDQPGGGAAEGPDDATPQPAGEDTSPLVTDPDVEGTDEADDEDGEEELPGTDVPPGDDEGEVDPGQP
jgi:hypothetical protein